MRTLIAFYLIISSLLLALCFSTAQATTMACSPSTQIAATNTATFSLLSGEQLLTNAAINKVLRDISGESSKKFNHWLNSQLFLVANGDAVLQGNLLLDWRCGWTDNANNQNWLAQFNITNTIVTGQDIAGLVVLGNLTVSDSLINKCGDTGPFLYVTGNLQAKNLIAGGSNIVIGGNATITEATLGYYNHGMLKITHTLHTLLNISDDHFFEVGYLNATWQYNSHHPDENSEGNIDWYYAEPTLIPPRLRPLIIDNIDRWDDLISALKRGERVVKNASQPYQRSYTDWLHAIQLSRKHRERDLLRHIPDEFKTRELCNAAITSSVQNLPYVPVQLLDSALITHALTTSGYAFNYLPVELKTREWALLAAQHQSDITALPPPLHNDNELLLTIIRHNPSQFDNLPAPLQQDQRFIITALTAEQEEISPLWHKLQRELSSPQLNIVLNALIEQDITYIDRIPGYLFGPEQLQHADNLYHPHPDWPLIQLRHSQQFWQYQSYPDEYLTEMLADKNHQARFTDALQYVWLTNWTEQFVLTVLDQTIPYYDITEIPVDFYTDHLIEQILAIDHQHYGYYRENLPEKIVRRNKHQTFWRQIFNF